MKLMFHPCVRDTLEPSAHRYNTHTSHPDDTCDVFEWPAEFQVKRRRYDARAEARVTTERHTRKTETATESARTP